jgi:hypothetical protein
MVTPKYPLYFNKLGLESGCPIIKRPEEGEGHAVA